MKIYNYSRAKTSIIDISNRELTAADVFDTQLRLSTAMLVGLGNPVNQAVVVAAWRIACLAAIQFMTCNGTIN